MTPLRDELAELAFLLTAAHGHVDDRQGARWAAHVQRRLRAGADAYGDSWATRPVVELLEELAEEAADLGAWAALAAQRAPDLADALAHVAAAGADAQAALDAVHDALVAGDDPDVERAERLAARHADLADGGAS